MKYGFLLLLEKESRVRHKHKCLCDCGATVYIRLDSMRSGNTKSCGCLQKEAASKRRRKHYGRGTPEYTTWIMMRDRCNNKNNPKYSYYGGRGISVCSRWDNFIDFVADMGFRPTDLHTIDRIDTDKNYEPTNCKWSTRKEQARNRRNTKMIAYNGSTKPLAEWCELLDMDYNNTNKRLWRGWSVNRAFTTKKGG
jgi:hypothetical protein